MPSASPFGEERVRFIFNSGGNWFCLLCGRSQRRRVSNCEIESSKRSWQRERRSRRNEKERNKITDEWSVCRMCTETNLRTHFVCGCFSYNKPTCPSVVKIVSAAFSRFVLRRLRSSSPSLRRVFVIFGTLAFQTRKTNGKIGWFYCLPSILWMESAIFTICVFFLFILRSDLYSEHLRNILIFFLDGRRWHLKKGKEENIR